MPTRKISRADKEIISSMPVSPFANRSGLKRNQNLIWSPAAILQDAINEADRNLTRMEQEINDSSQRTLSHHTVTADTNTPRTPLNDGVNLTPNSLSRIRVRRINSPSPTVNSGSTTRPTPRSSIEETSQDHRVTIEPENLHSESESDSSNSSLGLLQWRQKVQNADSSAYKKSMAQDEYDWGPSFTYGDFEDILQESNMEKTNRMIQRMQQ